MVLLALLFKGICIMCIMHFQQMGFQAATSTPRQREIMAWKRSEPVENRPKAACLALSEASLSRFVGIFLVATNLLTVVMCLAFFGDQVASLLDAFLG